VKQRQSEPRRSRTASWFARVCRLQYPTVMVGMGGVPAEATKPRLAPLGQDDAPGMLASLRTDVPWEGWRGAPALDKIALADAICFWEHSWQSIQKSPCFQSLAGARPKGCNARCDCG
jgi:hypothetical protein